MVRLKASLIAPIMLVLVYFNSTMVRLKGAAWEANGLVSEFQFHYGTIKSFRSYIYDKTRELFQFHYGTIKSASNLVIGSFIRNFNSTMVRLKVA